MISNGQCFNCFFAQIQSVFQWILRHQEGKNQYEDVDG